MHHQHGMNTFQALTLYGCHALSAWQARSYEFAVVLFTAAAVNELRETVERQLRGGGIDSRSFCGLRDDAHVFLMQPSLETRLKVSVQHALAM